MGEAEYLNLGRTLADESRDQLGPGGQIELDMIVRRQKFVLGGSAGGLVTCIGLAAPMLAQQPPRLDVWLLALIVVFVLGLLGSGLVL